MNGRRSRSRRNTQFTQRDWRVVRRLLAQDLSPEQISRRLSVEGRLSISRESIYRYIRRDKREGGTGGMGVVYGAEDLDETFVRAMCHPDLSIDQDIVKREPSKASDRPLGA